MRLIAARIQKYRSVKDTGLFEVDEGKAILVGPNEAGKSATFQALQQINPPDGVRKFDALRDYPRAEYNDITTGAEIRATSAWPKRRPNRLSTRRSSLPASRRIRRRCHKRLPKHPDLHYGGLAIEVVLTAAQIDADT